MSTFRNSMSSSSSSSDGGGTINVNNNNNTLTKGGTLMKLLWKLIIVQQSLWWLHVLFLGDKSWQHQPIAATAAGDNTITRNIMDALAAVDDNRSSSNHRDLKATVMISETKASASADDAPLNNIKTEEEPKAPPPPLPVSQSSPRRENSRQASSILHLEPKEILVNSIKKEEQSKAQPPRPPPSAQFPPHWDKNKKASLILHIGPSKTATTSIQKESLSFTQTLEDDQYVYLGRYASKELREPAKIGSLLFRDPCFRKASEAFTNATKAATDAANPSTVPPPNFRDTPCWKERISKLDEYRLNGTSIVISDEAYSYNVRYGDGTWDKYHLEMVREAFREWNVLVVATYRRYTEWILSVAKERNDKHCLKPTAKWPSETGKPCENLWKDIVKGHSQNKFNYRGMHYGNLDVTIPAWQNGGFDTRVLNFHSSEPEYERDNNKKHITCSFYCDVVPDTPHTCQQCLQQGTAGKFNAKAASMTAYNDIVYAAAQRGLITPKMQQQKSRYNTTLELAEYHHYAGFESKQLPLNCPPKEDLAILLNKSIKFEESILGNQNDELEGERIRHHTQMFWNQTRQYCTVDTDTLLEGKASWEEVLKALSSTDNHPDIKAATLTEELKASQLEETPINSMKKKGEDNNNPLSAPRRPPPPPSSPQFPPNWDKNKQATLIFHIGPSKTGTTLIQKQSSNFTQALKEDQYVYLGRHASPDLRKPAKIGQLLFSDPCFEKASAAFAAAVANSRTTKAKKPNFRDTACWKERIAKLDEYRRNGTSIVISDEAYSYSLRYPTRYGEGSWNHHHMEMLREAFREWNVLVVGTYRRYMEWTLSVAKERNDKHCLKPTAAWPSDFGKPCENIWKDVIHAHSIQKSNYRGIDYANLDVTLPAWQNGGFDTRVLNFHSSEDNNNSSREVTCSLYCNVLPDTPHTCQYCLQQQGTAGKLNAKEASMTAYNDIVYAAAQQGLITQKMQKQKSRYNTTLEVAQTHRYAGLERLPVHCPPRSDLERLLNKSIEFERLILGGGPKLEPERVVQHQQDFWKQQRQYCSVDTNTLLYGKTSWEEVLEALSKTKEWPVAIASK